MKIGVLASPQINLSHTFFSDYHRAFRDLSLFNKLFLVGAVENAPYATECLPLERSYRDKLITTAFESRYSVYANNIIPGFGSVRKKFRTLSEKAAVKNISHFMTNNKVDLLYGFPWYPEFYLKVINKINKPLVLEFWEDQICLRYSGWSSVLPKSQADKEKSRGYCWLKKLLTLADRIIVPTSLLKERFVELGADSESISVVPVCTHQLISHNTNDVKLRWKIPTNKKVIYYLGSLSWYHDLPTLLKAVHVLNRDDFVLVISGGWKNSFQKYAQLMEKISDQVIYTGIVSPEELDRFLDLADICVGTYSFAYPSGFFPGTVVRYMLSGNAIVATDLPEIREMFKNNKAGLLVHQKDPKMLADAIGCLLDNEDERLKLGKTAKTVAENNYLWKHHTANVNEIFKEVVC